MSEQAAAVPGAKECGLCPRILDLHCRLHGQGQPEFCDLLVRYQRDPNYGPDDVHYDLMRISTPEQRRQVTEALRESDGGAWARQPPGTASTAPGVL
jgi:hypothetical protein